MHNDFTNEVPPKFIKFPDRIEITSSGGLPEGLNEDEFFEGYSVLQKPAALTTFGRLSAQKHKIHLNKDLQLARGDQLTPA